ncbi:hypothetical protein Plim_1706 [Planctopirus limnophila DSM 3776]|uniref:Uncharacterized protein n=1 Tax=Planctopirus limnophila (strain ATCC 43296 / DSM 3776 / IFAM 1008 / Mu 290) TaxID=521674 RepID=D5SXG9_PLAL2|nr:hypothetical protein Plim_1706 [Planctopirus limnophila DSM 3776]
METNRVGLADEVVTKLLQSLKSKSPQGLIVLHSDELWDMIHILSLGFDFHFIFRVEYWISQFRMFWLRGYSILMKSRFFRKPGHQSH